MHVFKDNVERMRRTLVAGVVTLLAAAPALTLADQPAATKPAAGTRYVPTMADYLGVYDALQNYRFGVEKHDQKALESAFWEDGVDIAVPSPGQEFRIPLHGGFPPPTGAAQPGPNAAPPAGMGPPPGMGPPGSAGPASGGGEGEVWHLPLDSYIHFESATRATHYEYFLSIYPQPEKKVDGEKPGNMQSARTSIVGWPGHYEDILEKRHGEWRILQRKSMINQK
jgi:hypothetical protein